MTIEITVWHLFLLYLAIKMFFSIGDSNSRSEFDSIIPMVAWVGNSIVVGLLIFMESNS